MRCSSSRTDSRPPPRAREPDRAFRRGDNRQTVARLNAGKGLPEPKHRQTPRNNLGLMELQFLGTSSASPSISRSQQSLALSLGGETWLFDCGEGTQLQMIRAGVTPLSVSRIFISHMHGDHVFGLPSLLASIGAASIAQVVSSPDLRRWDKVRLPARKSGLTLHCLQWVHTCNYPVHPAVRDEWAEL